MFVLACDYRYTFHPLNDVFRYNNILVGDQRYCYSETRLYVVVHAKEGGGRLKILHQWNLAGRGTGLKMAIFSKLSKSCRLGKNLPCTYISGTYVQ